MKFSNNIRLKTTDHNFENCINVINYINVLNYLSIFTEDKLFYIINEAERYLPFTSWEFNSLELEQTKVESKNIYNITNVSFKNQDYSNSSEYEWEQKKLKLLTLNFQRKKKSGYSQNACISK